MGRRCWIPGYPAGGLPWLEVVMRLHHAGILGFAPQLTSFGRQNKNHAFSLQPRLALHFGKRLQIVTEAIQNLATQVYMVHLAAAEHEIKLNFVPVFQKFLGLVQGGYLIVLVDLYATDTQFLELLVGCGMRFLLFLALFIFPFAVIHDPADGWIRLGRYLNQVQPDLPRKAERLSG